MVPLWVMVVLGGRGAVRQSVPLGVRLYGAIVLLKSAINWGCAFVLRIVCFANSMVPGRVMVPKSAAANERRTFTLNLPRNAAVAVVPRVFYRRYR
ncbi:hypothetical protein PIB30_017687 [Stylosanthes scabra]|uniref:Secreted protein n=1 Tax=Stylosanthes scabra TaxID=79078 RepID=A0ABU6Z5A9_9FABA|nr:hypothetical protein [Stylosanthes scabra]